METATTRRDGVALHYGTAGSGETVAFLGTAGYGAWQWSFQYGRVAGRYTALVLDHRGTGESDCPPGPYDVATLAADLEAVLAAAGADRAHLVGAGLGGAVALWYAHEYGRARSLALFGTGPTGGAVDREALDALFAPPGAGGERCRESLEGALSPAFREHNPEVVERVCDWRTGDDASRGGFESQVAAWRGFAGVSLYEVTVPALVCHGVDDPVVPADAGRTLAADLPRGEFVAAEGRHLAFVESARAVTDRLLGSIESV